MISDMRKKYYLLLALFIALLGIFFRISAYQFNIYIHGDVNQYSRAAESLAHRGDLLIDADTSKPHFYSLKEKGGRFLEHNPLWPVLGSLLVGVGFTGFTALKILSLVSGIAVLLLVFVLAQKIGGARVALLALFSSAFSYALIDYSGNGAFYMFQTVLYVLFILFIIELDRPLHIIWLGMLMGLAWLTNQQAVAIILSYVIYVFVHSRYQLRHTLGYVLPALGIIALCYLPWGVRNYILFGTPFYSINWMYFWAKLGVPETIVNNVKIFHLTAGYYWNFLKQLITFWLPHNLYFANRKLFILAPIGYVLCLLLFVESLVKRAVSKIHTRWFFAIALVLGLHTLISAALPVWQFRWFIPMLPLVFILASYYLFHFIEQPLVRRPIVVAWCTVLVIFSSLTFFSTPSHTDYYDGSITTDDFGKNGELNFIENYANSKGE